MVSLCKCLAPTRYIPLHDPPQANLKRRIGDAVLGDDAVVLCGVTSKAGLPTFTPGGAMRTPSISVTSRSSRSSMGMDRHRQAEIDRGGGQDGKERDAVLFRQHGHFVRADLWRRRRWPWCDPTRRSRCRSRPSACNAPPHCPQSASRRCPAHQLPRGQARALQARTRSSAKTLMRLPCSCARRITPSAVP